MIFSLKLSLKSIMNVNVKLWDVLYIWNVCRKKDLITPPQNHIMNNCDYGLVSQWKGYNVFRKNILFGPLLQIPFLATISNCFKWSALKQRGIV